MPSSFHITGKGFEGVDYTSGIESLPPAINKPDVCRLSIAENVRTSAKGGIAVRPGTNRTATLSPAAKVHSMNTHPFYEVAFAKSGIGIQQSVNGDTWYDIGVTRTTGDRDHLFPIGKDVFSSNITDAYLRIAVSSNSVAIAASDTTITIRTGDIGQFAASGTVYINGDAIAYTGKNSGASTLTGVTGIQTGGHAINSIVTQTSTPSGAPKASCIATLSASGAGYVVLTGGESSTNPAVITYSDIATQANPELGYAFSGGSAGFKLMPAAVTAMLGGERIVLIGLKQGIHQVTGFSSGLTTNEVMASQGVPNAFCIAMMDKDFAVLTNEARVLRFGQYDGGFVLLEDPRNARTAFDYRIQGYIQANRDDDQSLAYLFSNPYRRELTAAIAVNGILEEFIYQWDVRTWVKDTNKSFACRMNLKGKTFAGADDTSGEIFEDNTGTTDMIGGVTNPIDARMVTGVYRIGLGNATGDFLCHSFGGLLTENGEFDMRIFINEEQIINENFTAEKLTAAGLMSITSGEPIGAGQIGASQIGKGGGPDGFPFLIPFEFAEEGETIQIEWEVSVEGTSFELRFFDIEGETEGELLKTHL